jgi:hypothetical protein
VSFFSRLFGGAKDDAAAVPSTTVVIEPEVAAALVTGEEPLQPAVNAALREYLDAKSKEEASAEARGIPFWLRRDVEKPGDIEDELRDRVIGRRDGDATP